MTRRIFTLIAFVAVLVVGAATARMLLAQGHGEMMGMMSDCPMMAATGEGPDAALGQRGALGLSEQQVQRLEALRRSVHPAHTQAMEQMRALHGEIRRASDGDRFDEAAVRAAFDRMGELHAEMAVAMLRGKHGVRQILTPEQRERLSKAGGGMMGMHGMMGGGMMQDCPMMKGGMDHGSGMNHHRGDA